MKWYRVTLKSNSHGYDVKIEMDLLRSTDGTIDSGISFFGFWDDNEFSNIEPFVHRYNDQFDWGTNYISTFPIRSRKLIVGDTVPYTGYKTAPALERKEADLTMDFTVIAIRDLTTPE